jgi:energy-converting hydrogenase Eha subunit F
MTMRRLYSSFAHQATIFTCFLFILLLFLLYIYFYKVSFKEAFDPNPYPKESQINYNDLSSPLYSHNVPLPINTTSQCSNFCGPNAQCAKTKEQCLADVDCYGCTPPAPPVSQMQDQETIKPYEDGGKMGDQGLQYSSLTTDYINYASEYPGSMKATIQKPYEGINPWTKSFNEGLALYNQKESIKDEYDEGMATLTVDTPKLQMPDYEPKYPLRQSATGLFYETTPPASNSDLFLR